MTAFLQPCPHCQRHIRTNETSCPFCDTDVSGAFDGVPAPRLPAGRLSRAALLALGTVVSSVPLTACASDDNQGENTAAGGGMNAGTGGVDATGGETAGTGGDQSVAVYGVPASGGTNQGEGTGGAPVYGTPPVGTGGINQGTGGETAGTVYGIPPLGTGGDDSSTGPVYGIAPDGGGSSE